MVKLKKTLLSDLCMCTYLCVCVCVCAYLYVYVCGIYLYVCVCVHVSVWERLGSVVMVLGSQPTSCEFDSHPGLAVVTLSKSLYPH